MPALINRNLTEHKGSPRIYLDDGLLSELGVSESYRRYNRIWQEDKLILRLHDEGKYVVSSKMKRGERVNVIDINTKELSNLFDANAKLRIAIQKGSIVIKVHQGETAIRQREASFLEALKNGALKKGAVFHGGGLMDHAIHEGFKKSGIASVISFAVEIDERYLNSSIRNNAHLFDENTIFVNSDVADVHAHAMPQVHVLSGGIPCTGASLSGRSKNKLQHAEDHESAGACFFNFLNIVKGSNPAICIMENVKQYMNTASFSIIKSVMGGLGYDLLTNVYNGLDFGASESRERMVCIAISKGLNKGDLLGLIDKEIEAGKTGPTPLSSVLDDLPLDHDSWKEVTYLKDKAKRDAASGKGFAMQILNKDAVSCGTIGAGYAKARSTEPRLQHPTNPLLSRLFNALEHARIKKAPERIVNGLSETVAHQVLGNGVIVSLFEIIAKCIIDILTFNLLSKNKQHAA
ncbi:MULTISPECIES: DNA cytosine methyltransferase [Pseudoalteromonas]|uniref:DNA cytosine methyltransferase n=1 Tax=Pseudoalteromonas TaxID=53246 RepID=UPI001582FAB1|nr:MULTISPECIES: DNA cytosine methyltransferase [Pseudoalteromonas]MDI4652562.1 DNA cytosine methyltransferase [Pseudoalteromonas shioyasakiensis]NUJ38730.1 DNA cytosine methyltransferase [Pseudoalteromonas sp. 0303]